MRIVAPSVALAVETPCRGCMCHDMAMRFGSDPNRCAECGCPLTAEAVKSYADENPASVVGHPEAGTWGGRIE